MRSRFFGRLAILLLFPFALIGWCGCAGILAESVDIVPESDSGAVADQSPPMESGPQTKPMESMPSILIDRVAIRNALNATKSELASKLAHLHSFDPNARTRILNEFLDTLHRIDMIGHENAPLVVGSLADALGAIESECYESVLPWLLSASESSESFTRCAASMLLGRYYFETLQFSEAAALFDRVAAMPDCGCSAHAGHLAAMAWIEAGDREKSLVAIDAVLPIIDTYPMRSEIVRMGMELMIEQQRFPDAIALSSRVPATSDLVYLTAIVYEHLGQPTAAAKFFRRILLDHPASPHADDSAKRLEAIRISAPGSYEAFSVNERIGQAKKLDESGLRQKAAEQFQGLIRERLAGSLDLECRMLRTKILMDLRQNETALTEFSEIQKKYPKDVALAAVFLRKAIVYRRLGNDTKFLEAIRIVEKRFRDSSYWIEALLTRGEYYRGQGKLDLAAKDFDAVFARGGSTATGAAWRSAWIAYDRKDYAVAASKFGHIGTTNRGSEFEPQANYWQARSLIRGGDETGGAVLLAGVANRFKGLYAGQRAAERIQNRTPEKLTVQQQLSERLPDVKATPAIADVEEAPFGIRVLTAAGYYQRASLQMEHEKTADTTPHALLRAKLLSRGRRPDRARSLLAAQFKDEIAAGNVPQEIAMMIYPLPAEFRGPIASAATEFQLDPLFVASVILQESAFDPAALSINLAAGNMQLLPDTFERFARNWTPPRSAEDRFDPVYNIRAGCQYLRHLLDHFGGSIPMTLAAYNAGEDRVDEWKRQFAGCDEEEWIEHIPFTQTRMYVKRILEHLGCYRMIYREIPELSENTSEG